MPKTPSEVRPLEDWKSLMAETVFGSMEPPDETENERKKEGRWCGKYPSHSIFSQMKFERGKSEE